MNDNASPSDHGEIIARPHRRLSWAWLFPVLAAAAAGWLFWSQWKANGPEIEIQFEEAPGLQAGKTPLIYRGIDAGKVTAIKLDAQLNKVLVTVRLKKLAEDLAREGTVFWIDRPVISLGETTGLDAIVQGNSLQARMGAGGPATHFTGAENRPLTPLEAPSLVLRLRADDIPFLDRGAPVSHRGVVVGTVEAKALDQDGHPYLTVIIDEDFAATVRENSRFWCLSATSLQLGPSGAKLDVAGIKALLMGGIEFDVFGPPGPAAVDNSEFPLAATQRTARASGSPLHISFDDGRGILAGQTPLCYLGQPIGLVEEVRADPLGGRIETEARLEPGYEALRDSDTVFAIVRPRISLEGISGLDTILGGIYIECIPGASGHSADKFAGRSVTEEEWTRAQSENEGLTLTLWAKDIPTLGKGAPVLYRGLTVGAVKEKTLDENRQPVLRIAIRKEYAAAVRANARFWRLPATSVQAGPGVLKASLASIETLLQGGIAFDVFDAPAEVAPSLTRFELLPDEAVARATSPAIHITFENGQGLLAGQTQLRHLGVPVGIVESAQALDGKVRVIAHLDPGNDALRRAGATFTLVRPQISLKGISGLETLVSGVFIDCAPGGAHKPLAQNFVGRSTATAASADEKAGLEIVVTATTTSIGVDAPVYYRGVAVGKVLRKTLASDGRSVGLVVAIDSPYTALIRANTRFWNVSGLRASLGFLALHIQTPPVGSILNGGLAFATPDNSAMGEPVKRGHEFTLNDTPRKEWLRWTPTIPLEE